MLSDGSRLERSLSSDCMYPASALLVQRCVSWELVEYALNISISRHPDPMLEHIELFCTGLFVLRIALKELCILNFEVNRVDARKISDPWLRCRVGKPHHVACLPPPS